MTITWSPAVDHVAQVAGDPGEGVVDGGEAVALAPGDAGPLLRYRRLGREGAGGRLLAGVEDADAEAVGGLDGEQGAGAAVEAGEHQHRLDRERADSVGGRSGRSVGAAGGDDRDPRRQACHGGAEQGWVGLGHRQKIAIGSRQYDARRVRPCTAHKHGRCRCPQSHGLRIRRGRDLGLQGRPRPTRGAVLFATHCSGCHTLSAAGTQGSGNRGERTQGPNLNQRTET